MKNKKPNIVFLFPDQFRSDFIESNGADWLETPNINSIAKNGINYKNAFSASPVCVPARTCLLTGMNAIKNGVASNLHNLRADWKEAGVKIFPEIFSDLSAKSALLTRIVLQSTNSPQPVKSLTPDFLSKLLTFG